MKRNQVLDPETGRVDLRYNPMSVDEDYFIPVRGGAGSTKIETVAGGQNTAAIEDIKYLRDKLFSALKVPMSYLSRGEGAAEDKATLAQKDIRFARTIQRLQRTVISELEKIGIIHLYTLGYRGNDLLSFKLSLSNPSKIAALQELEHWKNKFDIASAATEGFFSKRWIAHNIFGISDEEFVRIQREQYYDRKYSKSLEAIGVEEQGAGGGGGGGGLDLGLGGEGGGETPEGGTTPEGGAEAAGGTEAAAPEEQEPGTLLAAPPTPGKREDKMYTTAGARGKMYAPVTIDKRSQGARNRSMRSSGGESFAGIDKIYPGKREFSSLGNGIAESKQSNYDIEEQALFNNTHEVEKLIESLEKTQNGKTKVKAQ
jgi:hypothetical protein